MSTITPVERADWTRQIRERWQDSVEAILDVGRLLLEAKAALPHGEFGALVAEDLPFGRQTAFRLMAVAEHPMLGNVAHGQHLPPSWRTLYELTKLPEPVLVQALTDGTITPETERADVARLRERDPQSRPRPQPGSTEPLPSGRPEVLNAALEKIVWNMCTVINRRFNLDGDRVTAELAVLLPNLGDLEAAEQVTILNALNACRTRLDRMIAAVTAGATT